MVGDQMTNEEFKSLYHGWVTSKDPTKAAKQRAREKEYNAEYYQKHKEKLKSLQEKPGIEYEVNDFVSLARKEADRYKREKQSSVNNELVGPRKFTQYGKEIGPNRPIGPSYKKMSFLDKTKNALTRKVSEIKKNAEKIINAGKKLVSDVKDDIKFAKELYTYGREKLDAGKSVLRAIMNKG